MPQQPGAGEAAAAAQGAKTARFGGAHSGFFAGVAPAHTGGATLSLCVCEPGWGSFDCSVPLCPADCSGHGYCFEGSCRCAAGWEGDDCATASVACPHGCYGRGRCLAFALPGINGVPYSCACDEGWGGLECEADLRRGCAGDPPCSGRGTCYRGRCGCDEGYAGIACQKRVCDNGCSGRGKCTVDGCLCDNGCTDKA